MPGEAGEPGVPGVAGDPGVLEPGVGAATGVTCATVTA